MIHVIDIYGISLPTLLVLAVFCYFLYVGVSRLLAAVGLYRHVWHPPLFDVALYVSLLGLADLLLRWFQS